MRIAKRETVTQSNALARSAQEMELTEKRLILYTISRISKGDSELLKHRFTIKELTKIFGEHRGDVYEVAQRAATNLLERIIFVETDEGWSKFQWTTLARYVPAKDGNPAFVEIKLNEELQPLLLQLKRHFNTIPLEEVLLIPSFNSVRLFEILWHDSHGGEKTFLDYDLDDLKFRVGLRDKNGHWEKYKSFKDFRYVLDRAARDFKEFTSLSIKYKGLREGKSYKKIRFIVSKVPSKLSDAKPYVHDVNALTDEQRLQQIRIAQQLKEAGYSQDPYKAIVQHGLEQIEKILKLAREAERKASLTNRPIHNLGGLISWMLKTGVESSQESGIDASMVPESSTVDIDEHVTNIRDSLASARQKFVKASWDAMTTEQQAEIHDIMNLELNTFTLKQLAQHDWSGLIYEQARQRTLIAHKLVTLPQELRSAREYIKNIDLGLDDDITAAITAKVVELEDLA